ncbi:hypothetical protein PCANC_22526 [Puccinia coronata f. sp. avenae]|uniref:GH18 domain-containing protein n=1 Tax=Puccinia coronata f. sp. avenae TaxID=200324 RepID=A0A2N5S641_9BASI|nr:hypothetical protein PCANC_22526 [Puccinia coronata f. sp. avenae]PLW39377.1 hypothetical protein PCASD_04999 [Puccinia coronata f. sp. avenae]
MRLPGLISFGLALCTSSHLGEAQAGESSSKARRISSGQHNTLKSFVSRSLDLSQQYPDRTCRRADVTDGAAGHQRRDFPALTYPVTFSDVVSPRARLGQLIVNPSPYVEPAPQVLPLIPAQSSINGLSPQSPIISSQPISIQAPDVLASLSPLPSPITASYFPDWSLDILSPEQVQYRKFDIIYFAFGIPNESFGVDFTQSDSLKTLDKLVGYAHGNGTRVVLSVGGWGGSKFFSVAVKTDAARQTFVNNLYQLVITHNLDGIDIDWEYPGQAQIQDNIVSSNDSASLLAFFQLLRAKLGADKIISAAVTDYTFLNSQGGRMTDVSEFGKVLDYILIMNYDVWGTTSNPGPNAPFSNGCEDSSQPGANMVSSIKTWTSAGFPRQKILMGLAAYGYINHASVNTLVHRKRSETSQITRRFDQYLAQVNRQLHKRQITCSDPTGIACSPPNILPTAPQSIAQAPAPNPNQNSAANVTQAISPIINQTRTVNPNQNQSAGPNSTATTSQVFIDASQNSSLGQERKVASGVGSGDMDGFSGNQIQFNDLFKWGVVQENRVGPEGSLSGINGYQVAWDRCSSTPYVFSKSRNIVITYDDAISIGIKASYALAAGIGGVGFWDMTGDHNCMLIDSARTNLARVG